MKQGPMHVLRNGMLALGVALSLGGCEEPKQDKFMSEGGISPNPGGIIAGSVLYRGPRPQCKYDERGRRTQVQGRVVLTLFVYDNPPPPEGRATTALNIKFINAGELFTLADCLPRGEVADPNGPVITRTVAYSWPQIALGTTHPVDYQMRGFYDTDEDMVPFFSVTNLPTEGDIAGAALTDVNDPSKGFLHIVMPRSEDAKDGFRYQGAMVALGNYVWLERPAFKLNEHRFMDATYIVQPRQVAGTTTGEIDVKATLSEAWANTCNRQSNCGLTLDQITSEEFDPTFAASGIGFDYDPSVYAFVSEPVDVLTVKQDGPDEVEADGIPDPHPLLGSNLGIPWFTPIYIMTRLAPTYEMGRIEARTGIPPVRLIGSVLLENAATPEEGPRPEKRTRLDSIEVAVPAIAAVELDPTNPACRLPYLAPQNLTRAYESRLTYCSDLPTGLYNVSAIQGYAGGEREDAEPDVSDTGYVYEGGRLSGQAWTTPNDLGNPDQLDEGLVLPSQGLSSAFVIYDRNLDGQGDCTRAPDPDNDLVPRRVEYRGLCEVDDAGNVVEDPHIENPEGTTGAGIDGIGCLLPSCCDAIEHLCGVPLCEPCDEESCPGLDLGNNHPIRQGPTTVTTVTKDGKSVPNCVPFPLPTLCCPEE